MIELANDPKAKRPSASLRPTASQGKVPAAPRMREGHAWPFLSRYNGRASQPDGPKRPGSDNGS